MSDNIGQEGLKVGEFYLSGSVAVKRTRSDLYIAQCNCCNWTYTNPAPQTINWMVFCHNRSRRREGCKSK